jgi:retinol dehydrogenase 12
LTRQWSALTDDGCVAIKAATGFDVELWTVDLARMESVVAFVDRFQKDGGRLDVLVCNAGVYEHKYSTTVDGYETTWVAYPTSDAVLTLRIVLP